MLISRLSFWFLFRLGCGCLGLENQAVGKGDIAKINFRRNWISRGSMVHFQCFWVALEPISMIFVALETGLKFANFPVGFWGHPRSCCRQAGGIFVIPMALNKETWAMKHETWTREMRHETLILTAKMQTVKIQQSRMQYDSCNRRNQDTGSKKFFAAWWAR